MKIKHKVLASLLSLLALLILVAGVAYNSSLNVDYFRGRSLLLEAQLVAMTDLRAEVRNQLLETYEIDFVKGQRGHEEELKADKEQVLAKFEELEKFFHATSKANLIESLRAEYSSLDKSLDSAIRLTALGKIGLAKDRILDARENNFKNGFLKKITELITAQKQEVQEGSKGLRQSILRLQSMLAVFAVLACLLAGVLTFFASKSIGDRLERLEDATRKISGGELDFRLSEKGTDEVSALSIAFNRMAQSLTEARGRLAQQQQILAHSSKMSSLGEMAGGVAHEINNPLAAIKCLAGQLHETLDDEHLDRDLIKEMVAKIEKTTDRIAKIIQGLRTFSRDGSKDSFKPVNVRQLIDETLSFCNESFHLSGTELSVEDFPQELTFDGRATEVSQVLLNLLNNAKDAIADLKPKWVKVIVFDRQDWVELRVMDSGNGIPPEIQEKIFQPFFTTKEVGKGTGMGLGISIGIVQSHRGELKLDNQCINTCFVVRLPKKANSDLTAVA